MFDLKAWEALAARILLYLPVLTSGVLVFLVFWIVAGLSKRLILRLGRFHHVDQELISLLARVSKITLLVFGAVTALGTLGIDVTALVAGLGLTGFALGFALKDIVSNALSGVLILIYKPFRKGDQIAVSGFEGSVSDINLRYTVLETADRQVFIPNANLFSGPVTVQRVGLPGGEPLS